MKLYVVISRLLTKMGQRSRRDAKLINQTSRLLQSTAHTEMVILDAGCGTMSISSKLAKEFGKPILVGVDLQRQRPGADLGGYVIGDAEQMPLRSGSVDVYLSFSVLEHLASPVRHVEEVNRVLKPSGLAVLQVPNEKHILEPHSLIPFYYVLPDSIKTGLKRMMGYSYLWFNDSVTPEYVSHIFKTNGFTEETKVGVYHFDFLKLLVTAPSYLFAFRHS
ncbi:MAG: class I SAM-dependent methyltransferase [Nitrososphaerota archaeon]|nr:class I SAM-dependent methyltransferase [Nitrososphaerota archaeon]